MRNLIRTWARYSLISLSSMEQDVSSTSIDSIPRSVFAASARASLAAWRQLSDETPTRSMVFTTAIGHLLVPNAFYVVATATTTLGAGARPSEQAQWLSDR